jgi:hypothetical protein
LVTFFFVQNFSTHTRVDHIWEVFGIRMIWTKNN